MLAASVFEPAQKASYLPDPVCGLRRALVRLSDLSSTDTWIKHRKPTPCKGSSATEFKLVKWRFCVQGWRRIVALYHDPQDMAKHGGLDAVGSAKTQPLPPLR